MQSGVPPWGTSTGSLSACPQSQEQAEVLDTLKRELAASRQELQVLQATLESSTKVRPHGWPLHPRTGTLGEGGVCLLSLHLGELLPILGC